MNKNLNNLNWINVISSDVKRIAFKNNCIYVEFHKYNRIGHYLNCTKKEYNTFLNADSKGTFVYYYLRANKKYIRDNY